MSNETVMLQDPAGKPWPVRLTKTTKGLLRMKYWYKCCEENQITFGDILMIEVVKRSVFQLHVYKEGALLDLETQS